MIRFTSLARRTEIGANSYLLEFDESRILLDSGMHPKSAGDEALPDFSLLPEFGTLDAAVLSHAHLDHAGSMPLVQRQHPDMPVYMTTATQAVAEALLHNSVNVMTSQREELGIDHFPLFTHREVGLVAKNWMGRKPGRPFEMSDHGPKCTFYESGHVLGAIGAEMEFNGRTVFYTGDIHFEDQTIVRGADFPEEGIDVLILECTRGAAARDPEYTRWREGERLAAAIEACIERRGSVLIPVFALGKTQETVTLLYELQRARQLRRQPIHIGGLGVKMTTIYDRFTNRVRRNHRGMHLLRTDGLTRTPPRGELPKVEQGQIYAISSGMLTQHTMSNRLASRFLGSERNLIAAVGYADPDSPLGHLMNTEPGAEVELDSRHDPVRRECEVLGFDFSGHSPRDQLVDYAAKLKPEMTILVHGDQDAIDWMEKEITQRVPETKVVVPTPGQALEIG